MNELREKQPKEYLSRGVGNYINCTDYDDAIEAMKNYAKDKTKHLESELTKLKEDKSQNKEECYMKCSCVSYLESELKSIIKKDGFYIHQLTHERTQVIPVDLLKELIKKLNR